jgi:hypothetical protein
MQESAYFVGRAQPFYPMSRKIFAERPSTILAEQLTTVSQCYLVPRDSNLDERNRDRETQFDECRNGFTPPLFLFDPSAQVRTKIFGGSSSRLHGMTPIGASNILQLTRPTPSDVSFAVLSPLLFSVLLFRFLMVQFISCYSSSKI